MESGDYQDRGAHLALKGREDGKVLSGLRDSEASPECKAYKGMRVWKVFQEEKDSGVHRGRRAHQGSLV